MSLCKWVVTRQWTMQEMGKLIFTICLRSQKSNLNQEAMLPMQSTCTNPLHKLKCNNVVPRDCPPILSFLSRRWWPHLVTSPLLNCRHSGQGVISHFLEQRSRCCQEQSNTCPGWEPRHRSQTVSLLIFSQHYRRQTQIKILDHGDMSRSSPRWEWEQ